MKPFEYARPETETEAVEFLADHHGDTAVLAGGTDLITLMQLDLCSPKRVVDLKRVPSLRGVREVEDGVMIGALTTLEELYEDPLVAGYPSIRHVIEEIRAIQIQSSGTLGGDLCHRPNCWYYRGGHGLLAMQNGRSLVEEGDNRFHAIFDNQGPAKFVSASRFAPALIALRAQVRILGPASGQEQMVSLEDFYRTPRTDRQDVTILKPGQLVSHIWLPAAGSRLSATYEVMPTEGLDWPLVAAAVCLEIDGSRVRDAQIVMGHVAPTPRTANAAVRSLLGRPVTAETAGEAGEAAVSEATPLSNNEYKVRLAATAVKRAILKSVDLLEEGL